MAERIAFYDMDKTVTQLPTWTRFLVHAAKARAPWRLALLPLAGAAGLGYFLRLIDRGRLKTLAQRLVLGRSVDPAVIDRLARGFADREVARGVRDEAIARIEADRAAGYRLVLATASYGFYAAAIGDRLGFDDVIATRARRDHRGHVLSLIEGENCYGPVKLHMIENWMKSQGIARGDVHVRAYSDHVSDAPLLDWADEGFAVNAHPPLRLMAAAKGWETIDW